MKAKKVLLVGLLMTTMLFTACGSKETDAGVASNDTTSETPSASAENPAAPKEEGGYTLKVMGDDSTGNILYEIDWESEDAFVDTIEVPAELDGRKVDAIGLAFSGTHKVRKVVVNNGYTSRVEESAFEGDMDVDTYEYTSSIEEIELDGITSIGDKAFFGATNLKKVNLGSAVTEIGEMAFWQCPNLEEIHIPSSLNTDFTHIFATEVENKQPFTIYTPAGSAAEAFGNEYDFITVVNE